ncbi:hypothetical protein CBR_g39934 [Chara braunii]|uniref:Uncharacterized protein n=1 Tax=Chara braunii TaxID=69332 RepID=A0A388K1K3_CHABU|nr:hypothetical protein CBR_g39934 [Chara braunii]|eukprot:GBG63930.1 hypothetical protein CBR_g39934 [Chara braunii]
MDDLGDLGDFHVPIGRAGMGDRGFFLSHADATSPTTPPSAHDYADGSENSTSGDRGRSMGVWGSDSLPSPPGHAFQPQRVREVADTAIAGSSSSPSSGFCGVGSTAARSDREATAEEEEEEEEEENACDALDESLVGNGRVPRGRLGADENICPTCGTSAGLARIAHKTCDFFRRQYSYETPEQSGRQREGPGAREDGGAAAAAMGGDGEGGGGGGRGGDDESACAAGFGGKCCYGRPSSVRHGRTVLVFRRLCGRVPVHGREAGSDVGNCDPSRSRGDGDREGDCGGIESCRKDRESTPGSGGTRKKKRVGFKEEPGSIWRDECRSRSLREDSTRMRDLAMKLVSSQILSRCQKTEKGERAGGGGEGRSMATDRESNFSSSLWNGSSRWNLRWQKLAVVFCVILGLTITACLFGKLFVAGKKTREEKFQRVCNQHAEILRSEVLHSIQGVKMLVAVIRQFAVNK